MKKQAKVLIVAQEIDPFIIETEVATIARRLAQKTLEQGCEMRILIPCYGHINERKNQLHEVQRLSGLNVIIKGDDHPMVMKVASIQSVRIQVYFIDSEDYFRRRGISRAADHSPFPDNDEREIFFVRSVLESVRLLRWTPDVIYCAGWITALLPMYIRRAYAADPFLSTAKIVYSLFKERMETPLRPGIDERIAVKGLEPDDYAELRGRRISSEALDHLALRFADAVIEETDRISDSIRGLISERQLPVLPYEDDQDGTRRFDFFKTLVPDAFVQEDD